MNAISENGLRELKVTLQNCKDFFKDLREGYIKTDKDELQKQFKLFLDISEQLREADLLNSDDIALVDKIKTILTENEMMV